MYQLKSLIWKMSLRCESWKVLQSRKTGENDNWGWYPFKYGWHRWSTLFNKLHLLIQSMWSLYKERLDLNSHWCSREVVPRACRTPQARAHHIGCTEQSTPWAVGHTLCSFLEVLIQLLFPHLTGPRSLVELVTNLSLTQYTTYHLSVFNAHCSFSFTTVSS